MLSTALKPKWLGVLALCLVLATVFVLLSKWQFEQAEKRGTAPETHTEEVVELTQHLRPAQPLLQKQADQMVKVRGSYVPDTQIYIRERLNHGVNGYWVVNAFEVKGQSGVVIPVVRGWAEQLDQARASQLPRGELEISGRLLPPDAPEFVPQDEPDVYPSLATAELVNAWQRDSYSAVLIQFSTHELAANTTADGGKHRSISEAEQGLDAVRVGPQPAGELNLLNLFYAVEWVFFAGFAFFVWIRLVRDDYRKDQENAYLDEQWAQQWYREQGYLKE